MKLKATFQRKESDFDPENCEVSRVVELPQGQFDYFMTHLLDEQDFLVELREEMGYTEDGVRHCLLVLPEKGDDGILVDAQGSSYARYASFLPNARQQVILSQYQSLADFAKDMYRHAESAVKRILQNQVDGSYYLQASNLPDPIQNPMFDYRLLGQMLSERPEFAAVETMSSEILVSIAPEYQTEEIDESKYRELIKDEVDFGYETCVLNFASSTNPGGGVIWGSTAQEECLCRCSTLYSNLIVKENWERFYAPHRKQNNPLYKALC